MDRPTVWDPFLSRQDSGLRYTNLTIRKRNAMSNLEWSEVENFIISSPLWIASSHLTGNESALRQWVPHVPAAITLKTTSDKNGGSGTRGARLLKRIRAEDLYCDGDKTL